MAGEEQSSVKIRFLMSWQQFEQGQIVDEFHPGMADTLIRRGIVEQVKEQPVKQQVKKK
jgi:hypothetical protein